MSLDETVQYGASGAYGPMPGNPRSIPEHRNIRPQDYNLLQEIRKYGGMDKYEHHFGIIESKVRRTFIKCKLNEPRPVYQKLWDYLKRNW